MMTHLGWAPPEWQDAARETLAGLAELHPSRTILLFPQEGGRDALDADVAIKCYSLPELERNVCSEVIELRLHGSLAHAPASVVLPLVLPDLPVFLRWRGRPDFGSPAFEQLVDVVDRLVVDSREWDDVAGVLPRARTVLRARRDLRHRLGPDAALAPRDRGALAGRALGRTSCTSAGRFRSRCSCAAGSRRGSTATSRSGTSPPSTSSCSRSTAARSRHAKSVARRATCSRTSSTASRATRSTSARWRRLRLDDEGRPRRDDARRIRPRHVLRVLRAAAS